jgi:hypothetical protein
MKLPDTYTPRPLGRSSVELPAAVEELMVRDFTCGYVGQVSLAKDYGVFPMYRLAASQPA